MNNVIKLKSRSQVTDSYLKELEACSYLAYAGIPHTNCNTCKTREQFSNMIIEVLGQDLQQHNKNRNSNFTLSDLSIILSMAQNKVNDMMLDQVISSTASDKGDSGEKTESSQRREKTRIREVKGRE